MDEKQETKTEQQANNRPWLFKKGQSGNPGGRPKGSISVKQFAKNYLASLPDEEKIEFLEGLDKIDVWKMAEGLPKSDIDLNANVKLTMADVLKQRRTENLARRITGQVVSDVGALPDTGEEQKPDTISSQQSPAALPPAQVVEKYNSEEPPTRIHD